jgi:ribosomal protein L37AE/L43A
VADIICPQCGGTRTKPDATLGWTCDWCGLFFAEEFALEMAKAGRYTWQDPERFADWRAKMQHHWSP